MPMASSVTATPSDARRYLSPDLDARRRIRRNQSARRRNPSASADVGFEEFRDRIAARTLEVPSPFFETWWRDLIPGGLSSGVCRRLPLSAAFGLRFSRWFI